MFSDVKPYLFYQVLNARMRVYPFPHFYCESVFPDSFYPQILAHLPSPSQYESMADTKRIGRTSKGSNAPYKDRHVLTLSYDVIEKLDKEGIEIWRQLADMLGSQEFGEAMLTKFGPFFHERFGDATEICPYPPIYS